MIKRLENIATDTVHLLEISKLPNDKNHYNLSIETIECILYTVVLNTEDVECLESYLRTRLFMSNEDIKKIKTQEVVRYL